MDTRRPWGYRGGAALIGAVVAVSVLAFPGVAGAVPVPWKNCGAAGDVVSVQEVDASVWPPVRGESFTLAYKLVVGRTIPYATEDVRVTFPSGRAMSFAAPFSLAPPGLLLPWARVQFPIPAGPVSKTVTVTVPRWLRAGVVYGLHVDATSSTGARLICYDVQIPVR